MRGELKAAREAVAKVSAVAQSMLDEAEKLALAIERNEAYVLDLDAKADRRRSIEADIERLSAERAAVESALAESREKYEAFKASLPK